ncbi:MAG TPA: hypothetical protein VH744_05645 [Terriglobales bacterium]|jgi:hypothetical protein
MNGLGIIVFFSVAFLLLHRYRSMPRVAPLPKQGYAGAVILFAAQYLTLVGVNPVALYFTPIAWTGYLLWVDAAVFSLRGKSLLRTYPAEFAWLAACSIPLWLLFEAYNLRLANWVYVGLPQNWILRQIGYAWAFATIWPGIFETASLLRALDWNAPQAKSGASPPSAPGGVALTLSFLLGAVLVTVPVLVPPATGTYLFGAVWLGFIFLLEPIHLRTGCESLWGDLRQGDSSRLRSLLWAGLICGILWEFWNYWAAARWVYTVPILPEWRIFAMPVLGYLGFPAFAVECFAMFAFLAPWLSRISAALGIGRKLDWQALQL